MENSFQQDPTSFNLPMHVNLATTITGHSTPSSSLVPSTEPLFGNATYSNKNSENNLPTLLTTSASNNDLNEPVEPSFWIGDILEAMSLQDDSALKKHVACSCGEGTKAGFFCQNCNEHLCRKCVSAHYRVNLTKTHDIVKVQNDMAEMDHFQKNHQFSFPYLYSFPDATTNTCKVHAGKVLSFFCDTCSYPICIQCTASDHKEHRYQFLENVIESNKSNVRAMISAAKNNLQLLESTIHEVQRTMERVADRSNIVQTDIHAVVHKHMMALKRREEELINKVEQIKMFKYQLLNTQMEQLKLMADKLKLSIQAVSDVVNTGDGLQILRAKEKFQRDDAIYQDSGYVAEDDGILFIHPDSTVMLAIGSLGNVKSSVCAQQSVLSKDGGALGTALCGSSVMFVIHARDHSGVVLHTKPEAFEVTIKRPDNQSSRVDVLDSGSGHYVFHLHVIIEGEYVVSVQCRGVQIRESPYSLKVKYSVNYKSRSSGVAPSLMFGKEGDKPGELCRPWGICCDAKGFLIVADRSNNRIQIFNPDGTVYNMFGTPGTRPGQFDRPAGVAVDNKGHIIVVDKDNHRVQILRFDGTFVSTFGEKGSKHGQFNYPWDVDVSRTGVIAVTDTRNHRIQLFSFDGAFLSKYGFEGAMWKHFDSPRGVAFTHDNRIIVTDFNNHRLVIINADMKSARYLGSEGSQTSQFLRPQGVAVDEEGNIVVADSRNHRLQVFTSSGTLIAVFGGGLLEEGCPVQLDRPSGVTVTPDGRIAVVDFGNNRVVVF